MPRLDTSLDADIIRFMDRRPMASKREVSEGLGLPFSKVSGVFERLKRNGIIKKQCHGYFRINRNKDENKISQ